MTLFRIAAALCALLACHAQLRGQQTVRMGAHLGVNIANASASPLLEGVSTMSSSGLLVGVEADIPITGAWSIGIAPRFIEKGAVLRYRDAAVETALYNYIELPVAMRVTYRSTRLSPFLMAGATAGCLVSARYRTEFQRGYSIRHVEESTEPYDVSLDIGGGFSFDTGAGRSVLASVAYSHGLIDIIRDVPGVETAVWRSRDLHITIAVLFAL